MRFFAEAHGLRELELLPASQAKLMAQMETPTSTATAMFVCFESTVTTSKRFNIR